MEKSLDYAAAATTPRCARSSATYTEIPPEVLDKMNLPVWKADLNEPTIEQTSPTWRKEYGFIEEEPSLDDLILRD